MGWFPTERDNNDGWKFDIVSLVAVIGESTIERHVQLITASALSYLPRLLPAPQILLKTERPPRLPPVKGTEVFGVYSGTYVSELNFFADVIHNIEELEPYEYRKYKIIYADPEKRHPKAKASTLCENNTVQQSNGHIDPDVENEQMRELLKPPKRTQTETKRETLANEKNSKTDTQSNGIRINNPLRWKSMLTIVTLVSVLMLIGLFVWAACIHDGVAMIALATMSLSTSLACWANTWHPALAVRPTKSSVPSGDVVIKSRSGAFIIVQCQEEITRELYTCADKCQYDFEGTSLLWMLGTSTVLLMGSIVFFSNCSWTMQTAIGIAYIILNMMYWVIPFMMKEHETWDLKRRYDIQLVEASRKELALDEDPDPEHRCPLHYAGPSSNYTQTLWYAIWETQSIGWIKEHRVAPPTQPWEEWLDQALERAHERDWKWNAVQAKDRVMEEAKRKEEEEKKNRAARHDQMHLNPNHPERHC